VSGARSLHRQAVSWFRALAAVAWRSATRIRRSPDGCIAWGGLDGIVLRIDLRRGVREPREAFQDRSDRARQVTLAVGGERDGNLCSSHSAPSSAIEELQIWRDGCGCVPHGGEMGAEFADRTWFDLCIGLTPVNCIPAYLRIARLPAVTHLRGMTKHQDIFGAAVATV